ncbi:AbrB/MazE/SpoVT family DNA-binding domain-containing protein [Biomaibacter acetigenes]|jgi:AbrB family looped-hinge helix DNA binding protein|uniref:AbrB/MazE/SpoVT family DNA-binding domain-containing protein n=1 Tax=Biomaibacter acetigenes TaxID=2316383 RepID=A0A3G2R7G9_9FIRM|nr:AbrB/MazE/SpoVT family DNA-binding domain-containing protein [Biomaibacter acetigenes]AYO31422.1 AbrB/MazE/SpoVT family DNA-binding domain-containing protein [Biomaibacter acetigenes]MDN5301954.1 antitoxin ChpS [Thermoanaerobacteraceae bacterium]
MHSVKLSSKNQITIPAQICRALKIKKGNKLLIEQKDNRIILTPEPQDYVEYYYGIAKGTYGKCAEEMDEYVKKEREDWE